MEELERPGVFLLSADDIGIFAEESSDMRSQVVRILNNSKWAALEPTSVKYIVCEDGLAERYALKSAVAIRERPFLNCRLLLQPSELSHKPSQQWEGDANAVVEPDSQDEATA